MYFTKCDINIHDLDDVSKLIYDTEPALFSLLFGKKRNKALERIKKIVKAGNNSFGYEYIYLAIENNQIVGLTIIYKKEDSDKNIESNVFSESLDFLSLIKLIFFEKILISRVLTKNLDEHELYISNVCVDKKHRGKGIGTFLLNNIHKEAEKQNCKRIILDVSKDNSIAITLYKKSGFTISRIRKSWLYGFTIFKMTKELKAF